MGGSKVSFFSHLLDRASLLQRVLCSTTAHSGFPGFPGSISGTDQGTKKCIFHMCVAIADETRTLRRSGRFFDDRQWGHAPPWTKKRTRERASWLLPGPQKGALLTGIHPNTPPLPAPEGLEPPGGVGSPLSKAALLWLPESTNKQTNKTPPGFAARLPRRQPRMCAV